MKQSSCLVTKQLMSNLAVLILLLFSVFTRAQEDPNEHVFEPDRLVKLQDTLTVTGTVTFVLAELDGDFHIRVRMDSDYVRLSKKNFTRQDSCLIVEIICAHQAIFPISCNCQNYTNKVPIPTVGAKVKVTGRLVFDKRHKWTELHPVYEMHDEKEAQFELVASVNEVNTSHTNSRPIITREFNTIHFMGMAKPVVSNDQLMDKYLTNMNMLQRKISYNLNDLKSR
ncbi:MAG TPA: hypothetical protein VN922_12495 [Bacteroidia bacterium]|nr:hypothetical protein [Bacteroidia bacterium]